MAAEKDSGNFNSSNRSENTAVIDANLRAYQIFVNIYLVGSLSMVGILANVVSFVVLGRDKTMRKTTRFLLQMLAMTDTSYLVSCLFYQTFKSIFDWTDWLPAALKHSWPYIEWYAWPCASIAQTSTVWLVVVVTADRWVAICHPLHAPQYSTVFRVRLAVAAVWIFSIVYNIPRFFERVVDEKRDQSTNLTRPETKRSNFRNNHLYIFIYKTLLFFIVRFLVPFSALAFFNTCLMRAIDASNRRPDKTLQRQLDNVTRRQQRIKNHTLMLIVVVIVFVVCELPDLLLRMWLSLRIFVPTLPFPRPALDYVNVTSNLLLTVNSCVNFVIYCFMGRKFRSILVRLASCRKCRRRRRYRGDIGDNGSRCGRLYATAGLRGEPVRQLAARRRRSSCSFPEDRSTFELSSSNNTDQRISTIAHHSDSVLGQSFATTITLRVRT